MAKIVDITEKLDFDGNPIIRVSNMEIEVNADAATMLKVMGVMADSENTGPKEVIAMYELLFGAGDREKVEALKLSFADRHDPAQRRFRPDPNKERPEFIPGHGIYFSGQPDPVL